MTPTTIGCTRIAAPRFSFDAPGYSDAGLAASVRSGRRSVILCVGRKRHLHMPAKPPDKIAIGHDDYHAEHVGHTADGRQFFLTTPFVPAVGGSAGREFIALYLFDRDGRFVDARIDDLGSRADMDQQRAQRIVAERLSELGEVEYGRIEIEPFQVDRFGVTFGLVPRPSEDEEDDWWVEVQPGNYMAFHEPFDSGEYDT
jgi:hypothetical protein